MSRVVQSANGPCSRWLDWPPISMSTNCPIASTYTPTRWTALSCVWGWAPARCGYLNFFFTRSALQMGQMVRFALSTKGHTCSHVEECSSTLFWWTTGELLTTKCRGFMTPKNRYTQCYTHPTFEVCEKCHRHLTEFQNKCKCIFIFVVTMFDPDSDQEMWTGVMAGRKSSVKISGSRRTERLSNYSVAYMHGDA